MKTSRKKSTRTAKPKRTSRPARMTLRGGVRGGARDLDAPASSISDVPWDREFDDNNVPGLNRPALNGFERHLALEHAIGNVWTTEDISAVRRVESGGRFLWVMWRRATVPPA
jgi:hypothetical protein